MTSRVIYTAADHNYVTQACVLARSLTLTQSQSTRFIVLGNNWPDKAKAQLNRIATDTVSTEVLEFTEPSKLGIKLAFDFPVETAFNILAPALLFSNLDRVLYLDADMVVRHDLAQLFTRHMDNPVAAVCDAHVSIMGIPSMWRPWREEGLDPLVPYLNTGTLLIDVQRWNAQAATQEVLAYLSKYTMPCVDQDALNLVLRGAFDRLEPKFNSMPYHYFKLLRNADLVESESEILSAMNDPAIVHYHRSFFGKPWNFGCWHPWVELWRDHARALGTFRFPSLAIRDLMRGFGARRVGMAAVDPRANVKPERH